MTQLARLEQTDPELTSHGVDTMSGNNSGPETEET